MDDGVSELMRRTARLRWLVDEVAAAVPDRAEGTDRTGTVRVVLGPDGLPVSIGLHPDWQSTVEPTAFGGAVLDAYASAVRARTTMWCRTLDRRDLPYLVDEVDRDAAGTPVNGSPVNGSPVNGERYGARPVIPRPPVDLAEDVLRASEAALHSLVLTPPPEPHGTGADPSGALRITLSRTALVSCQADPDWLDGRPAATLVAAFDQALAAARTDLAAAAADQPATAEETVSQLIDEGLAWLRQLGYDRG
ncbi:MAG TPA: hypothetical protein VJT31_39160 [Rugosimonospora sp.]|nr:hypothetical protein [Rugosimonospora sp.]